MDFESALACLRSVEGALSSCELEAASVLEIEAAGHLDQLGVAFEVIANCRVAWGGRADEIKRIAASVTERTARLKTVFASGDQYCRNRLSISSISTSGYANPGTLTPLSIPGSFEAEG